MLGMTYRMRGRDSGAPTPTFVYWTAYGDPDTAYPPTEPPPPFGGPVVEIVVLSSEDLGGVEPNASALAARRTTGNGEQVYVETRQAYFVLDSSSTETPDGIDYIAAVDGGNWVRTGYVSETWLRRSVWYVDPAGVTASDDNTGLSPATALQHMKELSRRLGPDANIRQVTHVYLLSDCTEDDWFDVVGTRSAALNLHGTTRVVYTGTIAAYSRSHATNDPGTLQCIGFDADLYRWKRAALTSGASIGAYFRIVKKTAVDTARVTSVQVDEWTEATPAPGDTFEVYSQSLMACHQLNTDGYLYLYDLDIVNGYAPYGAGVVLVGGITAERVTFVGPTGAVRGATLVARGDASYNFIGTDVAVYGGVYTYIDFEVYGFLCSDFIVWSNFAYLYSNSLVQGLGTWPAPGRGQVMVNTNAEMGAYPSLGIFDADGTLMLLRGAFWVSWGLLYGLNPNALARPFVQFESAGRLDYDNVKPIVTGAAPFKPIRLASSMYGAFYTIDLDWVDVPLVVRGSNNYHGVSIAGVTYWYDTIWTWFRTGLQVGYLGAQPAGSTRYLVPDLSDQATEAFPVFRAPYNLVCGLVSLSAGTAPGAGQSYTCNVRVDGATVATVVLNNAETSKAGAVYFVVKAGQRVTFQGVQSAGAATADVAVSMIAGL